MSVNRNILEIRILQIFIFWKKQNCFFLIPFKEKINIPLLHCAIDMNSNARQDNNLCSFLHLS